MVECIRNGDLCLHREHLSRLLNRARGLGEGQSVNRFSAVLLVGDRDADTPRSVMIKHAGIKPAKIHEAQMEIAVRLAVRIQDEVAKHKRGVKQTRFARRCRPIQDRDRCERNVGRLNRTKVFNADARYHGLTPHNLELDTRAKLSLIGLVLQTLPRL